MTRSFARLALLFASAIAPTFAQNASQAQSRPSRASTQTTQDEPSSDKISTLKTSTQLVVVDVVVTDKNKKPIHGLKATDFTVKEGGTLQSVKNFEEHSALSVADATKFAPMPKLPPGVFTNFTPAPTNGAVNLLLFDALNTPMTDQAYVRQQLLAYLKSTPPGTRVAIFGLTSHLIVLQGFTSDPEVLKRVVTKGLSVASPILNDIVGGSGIQNSASDDLEDFDAELSANLAQFEAEQQAYQLQARIKYTLDAMNELARYLAIIPGRKNLIWFSGSFPLNILPDVTLTRPFEVSDTFEDEFHDTLRLLAHDQVAVYPVDARGLMISPLRDASTNRNYGNIAKLTQDENKFVSDTQAEHSTMEVMAQATGGRAYVGTNDLTAAVASAIEDGSNFYTITYRPSNSEADGKFRKIKIDSAQKGATLSYRNGYYADEPARTKNLSKPAVAVANAAASNLSMRVAMGRGAPTPSEILIRVGVLPMNAANKPEDAPAPGNKPDAKTHGPYRRYTVNYIINPANLTLLRTPDTKIHADFELLILVYGPSGEMVNWTSRSSHVIATLDEFNKAVEQGIFEHEEISTPIKGEYFLRIAVHDLHRDRYGVVEVPTSTVANVVPTDAPPAAPAGAIPK